MAKYEWVTVRVANCGDRSFPALRAHQNAQRAFTTPGPWGLPDFIDFQEVSKVNLRAMGTKQREPYDVLQYGRLGAPEAGVAVASRMGTITRLGSSRLVKGSDTTSEGGGIRTRYTVSDRYRTKRSISFRNGSGHAPPSRAFRARARFIASLRRQRGILGMDSNLSVAVMQRTSVRQYRGHGVLGVLVPRQFKSLPMHTVNIGSDHPAVDVRVRIPVRKGLR